MRLALALHVEQTLFRLLIVHHQVRLCGLLLQALPIHDLTLLTHELRLPLLALDRILIRLEELVLDADALQLGGELCLLPQTLGALLLKRRLDLDLRVCHSFARRLDGGALGRLSLLSPRGRLHRRALAHLREPTRALREIRLLLVLLELDLCAPCLLILKLLLLDDEQPLAQLGQRHLLEEPQLRRVRRVEACLALAWHQLERPDLLDQVGSPRLLLPPLCRPRRLHLLNLGAQHARVLLVLLHHLLLCDERPVPPALHLSHHRLMPRLQLLLGCLALLLGPRRVDLHGHRCRTIFLLLAQPRLLGLLVGQKGLHASPLDVAHPCLLVLFLHLLLPRIEFGRVAQLALVGAELRRFALLLLAVKIILAQDGRLVQTHHALARQLPRHWMRLLALKVALSGSRLLHLLPNLFEVVRPLKHAQLEGLDVGVGVLGLQPDAIRVLLLVELHAIDQVLRICIRGRRHVASLEGLDHVLGRRNKAQLGLSEGKGLRSGELTTTTAALGKSLRSLRGRLLLGSFRSHAPLEQFLEGLNIGHEHQHFLDELLVNKLWLVELQPFWTEPLIEVRLVEEEFE